jgi:hypothetical protein
VWSGVIWLRIGTSGQRWVSIKLWELWDRMNEELGRMWKEAAAAYSKPRSRHFAWKD